MFTRRCRCRVKNRFKPPHLHGLWPGIKNKVRHTAVVQLLSVLRDFPNVSEEITGDRDVFYSGSFTWTLLAALSMLIKAPKQRSHAVRHAWFVRGRRRSYGNRRSRHHQIKVGGLSKKSVKQSSFL